MAVLLKEIDAGLDFLHDRMALMAVDLPEYAETHKIAEMLREYRRLRRAENFIKKRKESAGRKGNPDHPVLRWCCDILKSFGRE